ncbi:hypothetical protein LWI28_017613 [Acer negundo]|uniref:methenyltetrahydrofolate cyclohydrolase n=1 Tax=Acer negundo TaxID=4023 RepID=A0AAD5IB25_ACENE|nr:hypothetical protein LWI28_017613 [Acer negundo]
MALQHYLHLQACKSASLHRIYMTQSSDSNDRKESFQQVGSPAVEFAPLAATFRRRLLVGIGSASLVAVGANFGGITSFLIGLSPETGRNLKLDVLYPIGGYSRCIDTNEGFEFVYPASWVGDQTLLYRAAKKTEFQRSLDPPPLNKVKSKKLNINEPVVAFGPPGSSGELNVSVIVSSVPLDFSIEAFGDAKQVGESIVKKITGSGGVKSQWEVVYSECTSTRISADDAAIINGKSISQDIRSQIADQVSKMKASIGKSPGLAIVSVGKRRDSHTFIRIKLKACDEVGIATLIEELPENCTEHQLLNVVSGFNENPLIHGIIVQLPLPQHVDEEKVIDSVSPEKDVDGFHPLNMGNLAMRGREPLFIPCASKGCIELLLRSGVEIMGKKRHHATVSTVHAFTTNPEKITREADIVVSDVGIPNIVRGNWLKPGAFVIDTGTNRIKDPSSRNGYRVTGDVCFEEATKVVSAITPVPGGIGPITISMLLSNTLDSAKRAFRFP